MLLSEFLEEVTIYNGKDTATPIELDYYDDYSWQQLEPYESKFFASLDYAYIDGNDFEDGELVGIEATDLGVAVHVVSMH